MSPSVSVVLPCRNAELFIEEALQSVLVQSLPVREVLVIDGHSTDRTVEVISRAGDARVRVIPQVGLGIPQAWNQGIEAASSEFTAFLSADDAWASDKLARQLAVMYAQPALLFTNTHFRYKVEAGTVLPSSFKHELLDRDLPGRIMETLVVRRTIFDRVGLLDTSFSIAHDVEWYARVAAADVPGFTLPDVLLTKRIHGASATTDADTNTQELLQVLRRTVGQRRRV